MPHVSAAAAMVVRLTSSSTAAFNSGSYVVFFLVLAAMSVIALPPRKKPFEPNPVSGILGLDDGDRCYTTTYSRQEEFHVVAGTQEEDRISETRGR